MTTHEKLPRTAHSSRDRMRSCQAAAKLARCSCVGEVHELGAPLASHAPTRSGIMGPRPLLASPPALAGAAAALRIKTC
jgi:hypothetical protein